MSQPAAAFNPRPVRTVAEPRTILYVHHRPELGGAPTSLYHLLCGLDRSRYRPIILCPGGDAAALFASAGAPIIRGRISTFTHVITCTYHGLRWAMLARELAYAIPHAAAVARLVRKENAALVHLNEGNLLLAACVAHLSGARVVCHFRGMLAGGRFGLRRRLVQSCLARWPDAVIAIDGAVAAPLRTLPHLHIIHNSVDLERFRHADGRTVRRELEILDGAPLAGMVGRVRADEGSLDFLRAAAIVQEKLPEAHFALIGGGTRPPGFFHTPKGRLLLAAGVIRDDLTDAQTLAAQLGLRHVRFEPYRRDVAAVYAALDVVVSGGEAGIGRQALEAAAAARPLIAASRIPVPDLLEDGRTGCLVPPGDVPALAATLEALLTDPARRAGMGGAARALAEQRFNPTTNAARVMALYDRLLGVPSAVASVGDQT